MNSIYLYFGQFLQLVSLVCQYHEVFLHSFWVILCRLKFCQTVQTNVWYIVFETNGTPENAFFVALIFFVKRLCFLIMIFETEEQWNKSSYSFLLFHICQVNCMIGFLASAKAEWRKAFGYEICNDVFAPFFSFHTSSLERRVEQQQKRRARQ